MDLWAEGGAVDNSVLRYPRKAARFAARRTVHISMDPALVAVALAVLWIIKRDLNFRKEHARYDCTNPVSGDTRSRHSGG